MKCGTCGRNVPAIHANGACQSCNSAIPETIKEGAAVLARMEKRTIARAPVIHKKPKRRARRNPNVISPPSWAPDLTKLDPSLIDELRDHQTKAREFIAEQETGERIF